MGMNEYIENLKIDEIAKLIMLDLNYDDLTKEEIDAIVKDIEIDGNEYTINDITYMVVDDDDAYNMVEDLIIDQIEDLKHDTNHDYDWLINCIDPSEVSHDIEDWYDVIGTVTTKDNHEYYYFIY